MLVDRRGKIEEVRRRQRAVDRGRCGGGNGGGIGNRIGCRRRRSVDRWMSEIKHVRRCEEECLWIEMSGFYMMEWKRGTVGSRLKREREGENMLRPSTNPFLFRRATNERNSLLFSSFSFISSFIDSEFNLFWFDSADVFHFSDLDEMNE